MGMSGLYVGLSGLRVSSNSLNTTANNLTNVNTDGYVRQQVVNKDQGYNFIGTTAATTTGQRGQGVTIASVNHVRDIFLDASYRKELGRQTFYEKLYDSVYEIETQMGESDKIEGIAFQDAITNILKSLNEVAKTPTDQVAVSALSQSAVQFIDQAQSIYSGLKQYQTTVNTDVVNTVNRINDIGDQIKNLNQEIMKIETGGYENAANLRDQRDVLLDELASYCKITYNEDNRGVVEVQIEGVMFADELSVNRMGLETITGTSFYNPVWTSMNNQSVYNLNSPVSTEDNTDIGGLKGLLFARGSVTPTVNSMTAPVAADYENGINNPDYQAALNEYNLYTESSQTSVLVNTMANFDKLVNSIVESINNVLCPETTVTDADGKVYTVLDTSKASVSADGSYGVELFSRSFTDRYVQTPINGETYYVRNDTNTYGNASSYTIMNIAVNQAVLKDYSKLPLTTANGQADYEKAGQLVSIFSEDKLTYNGGRDGLTFEEFYETLTNDTANTGYIYNGMADNEAKLANGLDSQRQQVMGVASDDELANMIKYQQAYNAASRYINVVSSMLESLINNLGA